MITGIELSDKKVKSSTVVCGFEVLSKLYPYYKKDAICEDVAKKNNICKRSVYRILKRESKNCQ